MQKFEKSMDLYAYIGMHLGPSQDIPSNQGYKIFHDTKYSGIRGQTWMHQGPSQDIPKYPRILSIPGLVNRLGIIWDYPGISLVSWDTKYSRIKEQT